MPCVKPQRDTLASFVPEGIPRRNVRTKMLRKITVASIVAKTTRLSHIDARIPQYLSTESDAKRSDKLYHGGLNQ